MNRQSRGINWFKWAMIFSFIFAPSVTFALAEYNSKGGLNLLFSVIEMIGDERQKSIKETEGWLK